MSFFSFLWNSAPSTVPSNPHTIVDAAPPSSNKIVDAVVGISSAPSDLHPLKGSPPQVSSEGLLSTTGAKPAQKELPLSEGLLSTTGAQPAQKELPLSPPEPQVVSVEAAPASEAAAPVSVEAAASVSVRVIPPCLPVEPLVEPLRAAITNNWIELESDVKELQKPKLARETIPHISSTSSMALVSPHNSHELVIMTPLERFVNLHCQMVSESFPRKCIVADRQMLLYRRAGLSARLNNKDAKSLEAKCLEQKDIAATKEAMMISIEQLNKDCSSKMEKLKAENVKLQQQSRQSNAQLTHRIIQLEGLIKTKDRQLAQCQKRLSKDYKCKRPQDASARKKNGGCRSKTTRSSDEEEYDHHHGQGGDDDCSADL